MLFRQAKDTETAARSRVWQILARCQQAPLPAVAAHPHPSPPRLAPQPAGVAASPSQSKADAAEVKLLISTADFTSQAAAQPSRSSMAAWPCRDELSIRGCETRQQRTYRAWCYICWSIMEAASQMKDAVQTAAANPQESAVQARIRQVALLCCRPAGASSTLIACCRPAA